MGRQLVAELVTVHCSVNLLAVCKNPRYNAYLLPVFSKNLFVYMSIGCDSHVAHHRFLYLMLSGILVIVFNTVQRISAIIRQQLRRPRGVVDKRYAL